MTEDKMVGCHHRLSEHELEQTPGDSEGQGSLAGYSPWGCKEFSDTTERMNNRKIPWSRKYSCLENSMDREGWWATAHRVTKSQTRLSTHNFSIMLLSDQMFSNYQLHLDFIFRNVERNLKLVTDKSLYHFLD